jgi:hypothetical protein
MTIYNEHVQTETGFVFERKNPTGFFEWEKVEINFTTNCTYAWGRNDSFAVEVHPDRPTAVARYHEWITANMVRVGCNS